MKNIEFTSGTLYLANNDQKLKSLGSGILDIEPQFSANETLPMLYKLTNSASFSCENNNSELLQNICGISNHFTLQYDVNVLIQRRWHKKAKVNKKWIKRYGMKTDTVRMLVDCVAITYDEQNNEFELDAESRRYVLRPDQKRKGLKIIW